MDLPGLNKRLLAVNSAPEPFPATHTQGAGARRANVALTARAVIAVSLLGAGLWYMVWKLALFFIAGS